MNRLPTKTKFDHPHICWVCQVERKFFGHLDYCDNCEEAHFICQDCKKNYESNHIPMSFDYVQFKKENPLSVICEECQDGLDNIETSDFDPSKNLTEIESKELKK